MLPPKIVNLDIKSLNSYGYHNLRDFVYSKDTVYTGRGLNKYLRNDQFNYHSVWDNPFMISYWGPEKSLKLYRQHILSSPELKSLIPTLANKTLGG